MKDNQITPITDLSVIEKTMSKWSKIAKEKREEIRQRKTSKSKIFTRPDGLDYIKEGEMRISLDNDYPGWSWDNGVIHLLGSEWILIGADLSIIDNGLPRKFFSVGGARIQFKKDMPHTPENVIDIDKNAAAANANAFKRAVNRLAHEFDDVYRKFDRESMEFNKKLLYFINLVRSLHDEDLLKTVYKINEEGKLHKGNIDGSIKKVINDYRIDNETAEKIKKNSEEEYEINNT